MRKGKRVIRRKKESWKRASMDTKIEVRVCSQYVQTHSNNIIVAKLSECVNKIARNSRKIFEKKTVAF